MNQRRFLSGVFPAALKGARNPTDAVAGVER